jgi:cytochrome c peroxidase
MPVLGARVRPAAVLVFTGALALSQAQTLTVPLGLDAFVPVPAANPLTREKVELGKRLFFDKRLSLDQTIACATCHDPAWAYSDQRATAVGIGGLIGERRSPRIVNRAYGKAFFWDGRAASLEEQVVQPIANPKEMGLAVHLAAERVGLSVELVRDALASYVRTIVSGDSPYDRYVAGNTAALTAEQRTGLRIFRGKAGCTACHLGPNLTDEKRHDTGIGGGAFKTPSLREAARTPPYMHDGSLATLEDVLEFYDKGGKESPTLDTEMHPLKLTAEEKAALKALLQALNGTVRDGL